MGSSPRPVSSWRIVSCIFVSYLLVTLVTSLGAVPAAAQSVVPATDQTVVQTAAPAIPAGDPDALYRDRADLANAKKAADIWAARAAAGNDFESAWKLARADYYLGTAGPQADQKDVLFKGIAAGKQAAALDANKPEGHFWYAANMGAYAQLSGAMTGLKYKGDIKNELQRVIDIAPGWQAGSGESALGQWYIVVPSFLMGGDKTKGIMWLRKALTYNPESSQIKYTLAETLAKDRNSVAEAKTLLQQVIDAPIDPDWAAEDRGFKSKAAALLATLNKTQYL